MTMAGAALSAPVADGKIKHDIDDLGDNIDDDDSDSVFAAGYGRRSSRDQR
jgi:hypothetical protein